MLGGVRSLLVIKHGALGDWVQATGTFAALRQHCSDAHITLLTAPAFAHLALQSPYFDTVWEDTRPPLWNIGKLQMLRQKIRAARFDAVVDLQNTDRTGWYWRMLWPQRPPWSGYVRGCSHPHRTPHRGSLHTVERLQEQLSLIGIEKVPAPSLDWLPRPPKGTYDITPPYALLVPGGAPHRPRKRWPAENYALLADYLLKKKITPVLVGTEADRRSIELIAAVLPECVNLLGRTTIADVYYLAQQAAAIVGNDTGPMHIAALSGAPCIVLYSHDSNPSRCGQRGLNVTILREPDLRELPLRRILPSLAKALPAVEAAKD